MEARIANGLKTCTKCGHPGISHWWEDITTMGDEDTVEVSVGCNVSPTNDWRRCDCTGFVGEIKQKRLL